MIMSVRTALVAAIAAAASLTMPASAEDIGVATSFAGFVLSSSSDLPTLDKEGIVGVCAFAYVPDRTSEMRYAVTGMAAAYSTDTSQPMYTELTCTLTSPARPDDPVATKEVSVTYGAPLPVAPVAATTPAWPVRPVRICISGYALFGPVSPVTVNLPNACRDTAVV